MKIFFALLALVSLQLPTRPAAPRPGQRQIETYEAVDIDSDGNLRITTSKHHTITLPKGGTPRAGEVFGQQTAFSKPVVSADRRAVGAQAMFANCCTSYDIPLQLVIFARGRTHRFEGLTIGDWHFVDGSRRVAMSHQTVHFGCSVHWELRDVATERIVAEVQLPEDCAQIPNPPAVKVPRWVTQPVSGIR